MGEEMTPARALTLAAIAHYLSRDDTDFTNIEMRWLNSYDGSTKWHLMDEEVGLLAVGFFPFQAEYRIKGR